MEKLKKHIVALPTIKVSGETCLSYQAVTDVVAAFLYPEGTRTHPTGQIDEAGYQRILETADTLCRQLGYTEVVKLTPPAVPLADTGLYWTTVHAVAAESDAFVIHAGPSRAEMLQEGLLLDTRLSQLGLDEVTRQHFKIPVTASAAVLDLMHRAVAVRWPNDYKGLWHDILGMCVAGGKDSSPTERLFTVIIRGVGQRRYWRFKAQLQSDDGGLPFLAISLVEEADGNQKQLFSLGHVVMTPGAAGLRGDLMPYLNRHAAGDWGELDAFDKRQNDTAVKEGYRLLSAYTVPVGHGETERIWIITEADRSATTVLLPSEY